MANTNGKKARKKVGGNRYTLKIKHGGRYALRHPKGKRKVVRDRAFNITEN